MLTCYKDEAAALHWPEDVTDRSKMVMPGDNVEMLCDVYNPIALENGQRFNIREGGRTVSCSSDSVLYIEHLGLLDIVWAYRTPKVSHVT